MSNVPGVFRSVVLLAALCAALCACQANKEAPAETSQAAAVQPAAAAESTAPQAEAVIPAAAAAPVSAAPSAVIATSEGDLPGMRVDINELKADSTGTLTMKLTLANTREEKANFGYNFGDPKRTPDYGSVGGVHLLDNVNKQKIDVMRDAEDHCVCSRGLKDFEPRAEMKLWAKFPAPAEGVNAVTVVVPHFIPMENVPITR